MAHLNRTKVVTHKHQGPRMMPVLLECQNFNFSRNGGKLKLGLYYFEVLFLMSEARSQREKDTARLVLMSENDHLGPKPS